ncbi:MAG: [Clostridia bacterium]|nr:[FeFe] hydrogenase H-cluster radical SAM maturase HydE [Clostridia bacterium]
MQAVALIEKLASEHSLSYGEYLELIHGYCEETDGIIRVYADKARRAVFGNKVYLRGLIEISNICKNDCYYCGIRKSNSLCERYRLDKEQILSCCKMGYSLGLRTFVLQGGEDGYFTDDRLCSIISDIKSLYPDAAVTLSLGERSRESYRALRSAGADRYLLRHETADKDHYGMLHPKSMSFDDRMKCLNNLRDEGFQVGCGFMVGSPFQTEEHIAKDLKFIEEFKPEMCGIGPFIPHSETPFGSFCIMPHASALTCYLLSVVRLIHPDILLPSTTALNSVGSGGRENGILHGANVIMPNLSPASVREKYMLYNGKSFTGCEAAEGIAELMASMAEIGFEATGQRGDHPSVNLN